MIRLHAPSGATSYWDGTKAQEIPSDGIVEVPLHVAIALQSQGFLPPEVIEARAARAKADDITRDEAKLTRDDLHEMLGHLGFAVADTALPAVKLVDMLKAGIKSKAEAVEKAQKDLADGADKAVDDVSGKKKRGN